MKPDIDIIVQDILSENPELALEVDAVREFVSEMFTKQPVVTIDPFFRARLRDQLLSDMAAHKVKPRALPWWFIYTVPVGVTAVLLFMIQPSQLTSPSLSVPTDIMDTVPTMMQMEREAIMKVSDESGLRQESSSALDAAEYSDSSGSSDFFTATFTSDKKTVRLSYLSVSKPAFISVSGLDGAVAVTGLILPGEHTDLMLPVDVSLTRGVSYTATLYYDNGDSVFVEKEDVVATDQAGVPVSMVLIVQ